VRTGGTSLAGLTIMADSGAGGRDDPPKKSARKLLISDDLG
jgi:hypothetical protein